MQPNAAPVIELQSLALPMQSQVRMLVRAATNHHVVAATSHGNEEDPDLDYVHNQV